MADTNDFSDSSATLRGTSREAERLIEQRIEELRAAALGPMDPSDEGASWSGAGDHESAAFGESPSRDALLRPVAPLHAPALPPIGGYSGAAIDVIRGSIARLETSLQEDVAKIEVLLRSWGSPKDAARMYGEQVLVAMTHLDDHLANLARAQLETAHRQGPAQERLIEAIAGWSVQLEQAAAAQSEALMAQLHELGSQLGGSASDLQRAAGAAATAAAASIADRMASAMQDLQRMLADAAREQRERQDVVADSVSRSGEEILQSIAEVRASIEAAPASGPGIDALAESLTALGRRMDRHAANAAGLTRQVGEDLHHQFADATQVTRRALEAQGDEVRRELSDHRDLLRRLEEHGSTADRRLTVLQDEMERLRRDIAEIVGARVEQQLSEGFGHMETVMRQELERMQSLVDSVETRMEQQTRAFRQAGADTVSGVTRALESLREGHQQEVQGLREGMRTELGSIRHELAAELDLSRVRGAEDTELVLDSMTEGWRTVLAIMQQTDERLLELERLLADD